MKVVLVAGPRNEEMVREIREMKETLSAEDWMEYCSSNAHLGDEFFDALYYACENADEMIQEQAQYFHDLLLWDEAGYFVARLGGYGDLDDDFCVKEKKK